MSEDILPASPTTEEAEARNSYGRILKAASMMGASSVITAALSVVRMKAIAVVLGPAGVGIYGLYGLVLDLAATVAALGIYSSGVRQVARAASDDDAEALVRIVVILNWASLVLGTLGCLALILLASPIAALTFGIQAEATGIVLLSIAVMLRLIAGTPTAVLQGTRKIADLARVTVYTAIFSTVTTVPLIWAFGERGIVPSFIATAAAAALVALWYGRGTFRLRARSSPLSLVGADLAKLLRLGLTFLVTALLAMGTLYAIKLILVQVRGLEDAGLYQAAWTVGGLYAGFILQAMGADFYPRLTGSVDDNVEVARLVNEQARVSLLLAGPGLVATLTLAPIVISILYSADFAAASSLLRWICLGMLLRVVSWPMGFIIVAKGAQWTLIWTEVAATIVHVGLAAVLLVTTGLNGAGAAFVGLYLWHGFLIYFIVKRKYGFSWTQQNLGLGAITILAAIGTFLAVELLPFWVATVLGLTATAAISIYSLTELAPILPTKWIPGFLRPLVHRLSVSRRAS